MKLKRLDLTGLERLSLRLAKQASQKGLKIGLVGPLGAGKTAFTRLFAKALGVKRIKSPTFTVAHCYRTKSGSLYHIDLYRLEKDSELEAVGLDEILNGQDPALVEWADKFPKVLKRCDAIIKFKFTDQENLRDVEIIRR